MIWLTIYDIEFQWNSTWIRMLGSGQCIPGSEYSFAGFHLSLRQIAGFTEACAKRGPSGYRGTSKN